MGKKYRQAAERERKREVRPKISSLKELAQVTLIVSD